MKTIRPYLLALLTAAVTLPGFATETTAADRPAKDVISAYLQVQSALAGDNLAAAKTAGAALQSAAGADPAAAALHDAAGRIAGASDLAAGRTGFLHVSQILIPLLKHTDTPDLYLAHCPMAFRGKGADWLQTGQQISNPYFGQSMLRCGTIKERMSSDREKSRMQADAVMGGAGPHAGHSRAELDRMHTGVPGYKSSSSTTTRPAACDMSCCATKS